MRSSIVSMLALGAAVTSAFPTASRASSHAKRATSCTFTSAAQASESQSSCSIIVLDNIEVPAGETLDLSDLSDGTKVGTGRLLNRSTRLTWFTGHLQR